MNKLFFDIETLPADKDSLSKLKYLYDKKISKLEPESDKTPESFEKFVEKTSFDGAFGRVCCIAYAIDDKPTEVLSGDEKEVVQKFWQIAGKADLIIGHNIRDFDLPFVMQRSAILGVKPTWNKFEEPGKKPWDMVKFLSFARYKNAPIFDTMHEWSNWGDSRNNKGLEHLALAMGIPTPKEGIDGSQVAKFYEDGKIKEICDYCMRDVETTREVYKRMTFEGLKDLEAEPF
jgi:DNA polymerase elongation subunit (family B)